MKGMHVSMYSSKDCMCHVIFLCSGCKALCVYSNQLMLIMTLLYLAIDFLFTYLKTRSAFFPFVKTFLHINQCLSSAIFSEFGSLSPSEAPGMLFSHRQEELVTHLAPSTSLSITQLFQITCCPCTVFINILIIRYEIMPLISLIWTIWSKIFQLDQ